MKISGELIWEIIFFPVWWYSLGALQTGKTLLDFLKNKERSLALFIWVKNIFTPMYGQDDLAGSLISFFVRVFQIIFRGALMIFWLAVALFLFIAWLALPILIVYEIFFQTIK